ncbi:MAG: hypothetical protein IJ829_00420 [Kiritimatiellae bacterium]|nr:hypothetical protein [Kiritimatiellia bacterium]
MKAILILSAALVAAQSPAAIRALSHDDYGNPGSWQRRRHAEKRAAATNEGAKVVFVGDSITHFWETTGRRQLDRYFSGDLKMLNLGVSADRTEHVLWRLNEGGELDGYEAKCVLLMIGTNNTGHIPLAKEAPGDTILGVREILRTIRAKQPGATVVLSAIFPRGATADDPLRIRNDVVNKEIQKFADGRHVFWCDFTDQFLTADGRLSRDVFPDLLHPGPLGYEIWHAAVRPYIDFALSNGALPTPVNRYASRVNDRVYRLEQGVAAFPESRIRSEGYGKEDWWLDRLQEKRTQIAGANGRIDLVFFGDSITHNWEGPGKASLDELRKTYTVLDIGYSGDKTENLLWRGEYGGELDGYEAKCVMLMIGTNNTWHRSDPPEAIAAGVRAVLDLVARKQPGATTLLLPIFPFGKGPADAKRANNEKANALIKDFADGKKVVWVDFNDRFLDPAGDNSALMPDNCHPNAKGYADVWLPAVLPHFKEICGR